MHPETSKAVCALFNSTLKQLSITHANRAVIKFQWLKDAEHCARMNPDWFNHKSVVDKKLRSFTKIGYKEPIVPPVEELDPFKTGQVLVDRAHQRYIAADAMNQLLFKTMPQRKLDYSFVEIDVRHQVGACRMQILNRTDVKPLLLLLTR